MIAQIKNVTFYILNFFLIIGFNILIYLRFFSEIQVEEIILKTVANSCLKPMNFLSELMIKAAKEEAPEIQNREEKLKLLNQYKNYTSAIVIALCDRIIWNKDLATKISDSILKEYFRKLSWQLRCVGLDLSSEVPSH
jgi:hypothetical protein